MRRKGKYGKLWDKARAAWIKANPPNHEGYYTCWICGHWVKAEEMVLDHIRSRVRAPSLRFVPTNFAPAHSQCNEEKGSGEIVKPQVKTDDLSTDIWGSD